MFDIVIHMADGRRKPLGLASDDFHKLVRWAGVLATVKECAEVVEIPARAA